MVYVLRLMSKLLMTMISMKKSIMGLSCDAVIFNNYDLSEKKSWRFQQVKHP